MEAPSFLTSSIAPTECCHLFTRCGLTPAETSRLPEMPSHQALWKIGDYTALTNQMLGGVEHWFCDTNASMRGDV